MTPTNLLTVVLLFALSFAVSTLIIRRGVPLLHDGAGAEGATDQPRSLPDSGTGAVFDLRAAGFWIGFCETLLIFVLVFAEAYSALAIIVGAKEFVRKDKIEENPSFYLLGTLANLTTAILAALFARSLIGAG
jgi:hypothetical protein